MDKKHDYTVEVIEVRAVKIHLKADDEQEARVSAQDFYANSDTLQDDMLAEGAIINDGVRVTIKDGKPFEDFTRYGKKPVVADLKAVALRGVREALAAVGVDSDEDAAGNVFATDPATGRTFSVGIVDCEGEEA